MRARGAARVTKVKGRKGYPSNGVFPKLRETIYTPTAIFVHPLLYSLSESTRLAEGEGKKKKGNKGLRTDLRRMQWQDATPLSGPTLPLLSE